MLHLLLQLADHRRIRKASHAPGSTLPRARRRRIPACGGGRVYDDRSLRSASSPLDEQAFDEDDDQRPALVMSTRRALALSIRAVHRPARQASALSPGRSASTVSAATEADPAPSPDPVPPIPVEPVLPDPQLDRLGYPRLPNISRQWRNPYAKWDDPQERVNLNETVGRVSGSRRRRACSALAS